MYWETFFPLVITVIFILLVGIALEVGPSIIADLSSIIEAFTEEQVLEITVCGNFEERDVKIRCKCIESLYNKTKLKRHFFLSKDEECRKTCEFRITPQNCPCEKVSLVYLIYGNFKAREKKKNKIIKKIKRNIPGYTKILSVV